MGEGHAPDVLINAAKRVADKVFDATKVAAEQKLFAAYKTGRSNSSSHIEAEEQVFIDGYARLCIEAADRVASLATEGVGSYVSLLENLLRQYWTPTVNEFLNSAVQGDRGIARNEANKVAHAMEAKMERAMKSALEDFRLHFPADGTAIRSTIAPADRITSSQGIGRAVGYSATVLKVMIASPSDVAAERNIVRDVVHEWNAVHSEDRSIVLLPVGWESHSSPAMGDRPQEIINQQVLRGCDILIAVFWTKFGTPTGKAGSGTAEEIDEHLQAGKPALLYFSSEPVSLDSVNPDQFRELKAFEAQKLHEGLIERYETKAEFREKLARQLAQTIIREFGRGDTATDASGTLLPQGTQFDQPGSEPLGNEAKELLIEAAQDKNGIIMRVDSMSGLDVQTNGREFVQSDEARVQARWRAAVDELWMAGLIEDRRGKGEVFFVTDEGYRRADRLAQGR